MSVCVETESAPSAAQRDAWRRLWSLLLDNPAPSETDSDCATNNADAEEVGVENR